MGVTVALVTDVWDEFDKSDIDDDIPVTFSLIVKVTLTGRRCWPSVEDCAKNSPAVASSSNQRQFGSIFKH